MPGCRSRAGQSQDCLPQGLWSSVAGTRPRTRLDAEYDDGPAMGSTQLYARARKVTPATGRCGSRVGASGDRLGELSMTLVLPAFPDSKVMGRLFGIKMT